MDICLSYPLCKRMNMLMLECEAVFICKTDLKAQIFLTVSRGLLLVLCNIGNVAHFGYHYGKGQIAQ